MSDLDPNACAKTSTSGLPEKSSLASILRSVGDRHEGIYNNSFNTAVLIAGLGYLVDTYDFFVYNGMRSVSLTSLGLSGEELTRVGIIILNCQILGALLGSFIWGILGDKFGRKKALLASIFIYSLGMLANGCVSDALTYGIVRFIVGFGVAGEVGLGATLIAETVEASKRTYALMFFTIMGVLGVTAAGAIIELFSWRASCFAGGIFGLILLTVRSLLFESPLFMQACQAHSRRGSLKDLFGRGENLRKYLLCVPLLGCNFFVTGILLTLSPEIARATETAGTIKANIALAIYFAAAALGDWLSAWLSNKYQSRRKVVAAFILGNVLLSSLFLLKIHPDAISFYALCFAFGLFNLWAIAGTIVVEQFATQIRATAVTSNINCSRALVILMNLAFLCLKPIGIAPALMVIGGVIFALASICLSLLPESYGRSLTGEGS